MVDRLKEAVGSAGTSAAQGRDRRLFGRFRRSQDGSAAVEFAFVITPFLMLAWAIIETGMMFWTNQILEDAVSKASRLLLTGESRTQYASKDPLVNTAAFRDAVCGVAPTLIDCSKLAIDVRAYSSFGDADSGTSSGNPIASGNIDTRDFSYRQPNADQIVVVRAVLDYKLLLTGWASTGLANIGGANSGRRGIVVSAAFRTEPYTQ